jgi:hypothetical protein
MHQNFFGGATLCIGYRISQHRNALTFSRIYAIEVTSKLIKTGGKP